MRKFNWAILKLFIFSLLASLILPASLLSPSAQVSGERPSLAVPSPLEISPGMGVIQGILSLQGRSDDGGVDVYAYISHPYEAVHTTTDAEGRFSLELPPGTYHVVAHLSGYLEAWASGVMVEEGKTTLLSRITLPAGDVDGDGRIDGNDLSLIAASFNQTGSADVNGDGFVDLYDLVLVGINFGKAGPIPWLSLPLAKRDIGAISSFSLADPEDLAPHLPIDADLGNAIVFQADVRDATPNDPDDEAFTDITIDVNGLDAETCQVFKVGYGFLEEVPDVTALPTRKDGNEPKFQRNIQRNTITIRLYPGDPLLGIIRAGTIDPPALAWATGPEGILLRWFWPKGRFPHPEAYRVYRDGNLMAQVERIADEEEALGILGSELWDWIRSHYSAEAVGRDVNTVADFHELLDENPALEQWLCNRHYQVALVRGLGYLDEDALEGETHKYRVEALFPEGGHEIIGELEIAHKGLTPLPPPTGLQAVPVLDTSLLGSPDWAKAQKNRRAHARVFLRWDLLGLEGGPPAFWISGYDIYRAEAPSGPFTRINEEPVVPMPTYNPPGLPQGVSYEMLGFYYVDADPALQPCQPYYYRVAPRDLLGHSGELSEFTEAIPPDTIPPSPPQNLEAFPDHLAGEVELVWDALPPEEGAAKYRIYRSTAPRAAWLEAEPSYPHWEEVGEISAETCGPGEHLFSVEAAPELEKSLNNGLVPPALKEALEDIGYSPSEEAIVFKTDEKSWRIHDRERRFLIVEEEGNLEVFNVATCAWTDISPSYEQRYWYVVRAEDAPCGASLPNLSAPSQPVTAILHDRIPPSKPSVRHKPEFPGTVRLCLGDPSKDEDVTHFLVYASFDGGGTYFYWREIERSKGETCLDFEPGKLYQPPIPVNVVFKFVAVDGHGNRSEFSDSIQCTLGPEEAPLPSKPIIIQIETLEGGDYGWTARVSWEAEGALGLSGFRIYRYLAQGGEPDPTTEELVADESVLGPDARSFKDETVQTDYVYAYVVAAYRQADPSYGPEAEVRSTPRLYKVVPPLECCTRTLGEIVWSGNSQYIPDTGVDLHWLLPMKYRESPYCVVFRSLWEDHGYVQITPPIKESYYLDTSARHPDYWYVVLQLDPETGEPTAKSEPWKPTGTYIPPAPTPIDARPEGEAPGPGDFTGPYPGEGMGVLHPVADASLSSAQPSKNFGSDPTLRIYYRLPYHGKALIKFDLSQLPPNAAVKGARFKAYLSQRSGNADISLYKVLAPWEEATVDWDSQPATEPDPVATAPVEELGWYSWNISDLAKSWWDMSGPNYGLLMAGPVSGFYDLYFASREAEEKDKPFLEVTYDLFPEQLKFGDEFVVQVTKYYSGSTLDSLSGEGMIALGGQDFPVSFFNVSADSYGNVLEGEAMPYIGMLPVDYPGGFYYEILDLTVDETGGWGGVRLYLPEGITAFYEGTPQEPLSLQVRIHPDLSFEGVFDPTSLSDQSCSAETPSFYFELDPLPLRVVPTAKVFFRPDKVTFDSACTQYEERYSGTRPVGTEPDASDGWLRTPYESQGQVEIRSDGLHGKFSTPSPVEYTTAIPYGFHFRAQGVDFEIMASEIAAGKLGQGTLDFKYYQTADRTISLPLIEFSGNFEELEIGRGGLLYGPVATSQVLQWAAGGFALDATQYELYIPSLQTQGMPWKDAWGNPEEKEHIQPGLNYFTGPDKEVNFTWSNCGNPAEKVTFEATADIYVRRGGVSDFIEAKIPPGEGIGAQVYGYQTKITSFRLTFCDNYIFDSDVSGDLYLPYPSDLTIPLVGIELNTNTACAEGGRLRGDVETLIPAYWQVTLREPKAVEWREPEPGQTLPWDGSRALWVLDSMDVPHLSLPGSAERASIPAEVSFAPDGDFYAFNLLYTDVYYRLDGFSFLLEGVRLNSWLNGSPEAPDWVEDANVEDPPEECPKDFGFIVLKGQIVAPFFGELKGDPDIYLLAWDNPDTERDEGRYIGFSRRPRAERNWTILSLDFDLLYVHDREEERGIFSGYGSLEFSSILTLDQGAVIGPETAEVFLGLASGSSVLKAVQDTMGEDFSLDELPDAAIPDLTDRTLLKLGLDMNYVKLLRYLSEAWGGLPEYNKIVEKIDQFMENPDKGPEWFRKLVNWVHETEGFEAPVLSCIGGDAAGELKQWLVRLLDMRGQAEFDAVWDGGQIVDWELAALKVQTWFEAGDLVKAKKIRFEINRDGDYILYGKGIKSKIFEHDKLSVDFIISINVEQPEVEGGVLLHKLEFEVVKFKKAGGCFGVGEDLLYLGILGDFGFQWGTLGGALLFGSIDPTSQVLRNMGFADLLENIGETGLPEGATLSGGYLRGYGDFPIYNYGCVFRISVGGRIAIWYFADGGAEAFGGKIGGYAYGKALCVVSARGDLMLSLFHQAGVEGPCLAGEFWVAGGIGWCDPGSWGPDWDDRWWDDSWCWQCGAYIEANYNVDKPNDWFWDWDADYE